MTTHGYTFRARRADDTADEAVEQAANLGDGEGLSSQTGETKLVEEDGNLEPPL